MNLRLSTGLTFARTSEMVSRTLSAGGHHMNSMTRRKFFAGAGAISTLAALPVSGAVENTQGLEWPAGNIENPSFRLSLSPREGLRNTRLLHVPSGLILADADYSYS